MAQVPGHIFSTESYKAHPVIPRQENLVLGSRLIRVKFLPLEKFSKADISSISHYSRALALCELL